MDYNDPNKKEEKEYPDIEKIENSGATIKKQSALKKAAKQLVAGDFNSIKDEFIVNWLVPQIQYLIVDGVNSILESAFGIRGTIPGGSGRSLSSKKKTDYNGISKKRTSGYSKPSDGKSIYDVPEIIVPDRATGEAALYKCREYLQEYDAVPVDKLLDCLDISGDFVDTKWGWRNLDDACVKPTRDGWVFVLPDPECLAK